MSRKTKLLAVALTAIMVLSVFAYAPAAASADASTQANTLLVDDDHGADHNDDTDNDNEYETIQGAVNDAEPGDTIEVAPGTYNENVKVDVGDIVIDGAGASDVTVTGVGNGNATMTLGADDIHFSGFTVNTAPSPESTPALAIYDLINESHVKGVVVEDNVFVGHDDTDTLGGAGPPWGNRMARDLTIRNNEFTGGTLGSMEFGFVLNAHNSTMASNTFSTKVNWSSLAVTGWNNNIQDTTVEYPGYAYAGVWLTDTAFNTNVDTLSVDGHPDQHQHQDPVRGDWLKYGVYVAGDGSTLTNVDAHEAHIGINIAPDEVEFPLDAVPDDIQLPDDVSANYHQTVYNVMLTDSQGDHNRNHDLRILRSRFVSVDNFDAMSAVMPSENEWSDFKGSHPTSGANVFAHVGDRLTLGNVTSHSASPVGIAMHNVQRSTVDNANISNKGGPVPDLNVDWGNNDRVQLDTTGISLVNSNANTISNSLVVDNDVGVSITYGQGNKLIGNNPGIYNNSETGVYLRRADNTLLKDNDIRDNGDGLHVEDSRDVRAKYNNFVGNDRGIVEEDSSWFYTADVDARWNWFGATDGPSGPATDGVLSGSGDSIHADDGEMPYDPFLTAPKDEVQQDPDKTTQYAHDLVTQGSQGIQTVGTPGPAEVSFQFSQGANAGVWMYESGSFTQLTSPVQQADTLDAYLISDLDHTDHARVVIEFDTTTPSTPGSKSLDAGWNFVTAPQYGATEDVIRPISDVERVHNGYDQFTSQPRPSSAPMPASSAFSHPINLNDNDPGPNLSAYSGYWVYVNSDGEMTAAIPAGVTITEEEGLIAV